MNSWTPQQRKAVADGLHLVSPAACAELLTCHKQMGAGKWVRAPHLNLISEKLVELAVGEITRLMVLLPPRHGKSEQISHWFPTWALSLLPQKRVMHATYGFDFGREWGIKVRNTLTEHFPDLGISVVEDSRAAHRWKTREGGGMVCSGVGGEFTGRGGDILILDDPTKNAQEASSATIQKRNWDWWRGTFRTRLEPGGVIVALGTRWDENDLLGMLLKAYEEGLEAEGYEPWTVLRIPAVAEVDAPDGPDPLGRMPGQALWPERYDELALAKLKVSVGDFVWAAQFQQRPVPIGGGLIKHAWFNYWVPAGTLADWPDVIVDGRKCRVVELPETGDADFQSWDCNFRDSVRPLEEGREPDAVAGHKYRRKGADLFLIDRFHGRVGLNETIHAVREMSQSHPLAPVKLVEFAANGPAVIAKLEHEVGGFIPVTPVGSKVSRVIGSGATEADKHGRAVSMAASCQAGNFYLPHPGLRTWTKDLRDLLGKFPKDGKDDTDAMSQAWAWAQAPAWQAVDKAHREAIKDGRPLTTTTEIMKKLIQDRIKQGNRVRNPYRRAR